MTSTDIRNALVLYENGSPFYWRRQMVCLPNSNSFTSWEADLLVCSKAGYLTEIEIKISRSDWKADAKKEKFKLKTDGSRRYGWGFIKTFWYAVPLGLADEWPDMGIPEWAGVYGVAAEGYCKLIKPARPIENHRRLNDKQQFELMRLASCRIWTSQGI